MKFGLICAVFLTLLAGTASAQEEVVAAAVLRVEHDTPLPISRLELPTEDLGFAGGVLATADNNTTGSFLGQTFTVETISVPATGAVPALEALMTKGVSFVVTLADADTTLALANAAAGDALILNALSPDDGLRNQSCRINMLHIAPSRSMLADALAQFLIWKRWDRWFLIEGSHPEDTAMADAYRRSAEKFGAKIVESRVFEDTGGARRTDSGLVQIQAQLPLFTQRAAEHDVVVVADESQVFAAYIPYHTWEPRPVVGSAGLRPVSWHPSHEAWGATQIQRRFEALAGRQMRPEDYNVWVALRAIGEAATRTGSADPQILSDYILQGGLELGAFKGQPLTFRDWNGQLRQPILLAADDIVVSVSPQDAFVHQVSPLDTLGVDRPESQCRN